MKKIGVVILSCLIMGSAASADYCTEDLEQLAHIIMGEMESGSWEGKLAVGSVVLNRVVDSRFPDTIGDVIWQEGQYSPTWDGRYWLEPNEESWSAAEYLLTYGSQLPGEVIWQAEFQQGNGLYQKIDGNYFCY